MNEHWVVNDEATYLSCYRSTVAEVYRYAARLCGNDRFAAEDLVQDVYLAALRKAKDGSLGTISTGYLVTSVRNRFLDSMKSADRQTRRLALAWSAPDASAEAEEPTVDRLADLPDRERAAMVLRYVDDMSVAAVARSMDLSVHAAESLLARATRRLRGQEQRHA